MCGITGILKKEGRAVDKATLLNMNQALFHRGPDDDGVFIQDNFGFAMRRLSILDVEGGKQPLWSEDGRYGIVFNGEIYNSPALRVYLEKRGHRFKTRTDTECIVHLYEDVQENCVEHLRGMFAFAVWDTKEKKLFLARDRLGIKPLLYTQTPDGAFLFSSEIKSFGFYPEFLAELDEQALDLYFTLLYIPAPRTIFRGLYKLPAGHTLTIQNNEKEIRCYWTPPEQQLALTAKEAGERLRELLHESVNLHLLSDVPIGVFLSGGIDSSAVTALASLSYPKLRTFTVGFEETRYNEIPFAKTVTSRYHTEHTEIYVKAKDIRLAENVISQMGEPFADSSFLLTYIIAKEARKYVKVCLSGDGGDELFGGYSWLTKQKFVNAYQTIPKPLRQIALSLLTGKTTPEGISVSRADTLRRFVHDASLPPLFSFARRITCFNQEEKQRFYSPDFMSRLGNMNPLLALFKNHMQNGDDIHNFMCFDFNVYLPDDILWKVDRMSMLNSLEVRPPFLDHELVEFALSLPYSQKSLGFVGKKILRDAILDLLPEQALVHRKQGFSIPLHAWFRGELRPWFEGLLEESACAADGYFNKAYMKNLMEKHCRMEVDVRHHLWAFAVFEIWYRNVYKGYTRGRHK